MICDRFRHCSALFSGLKSLLHNGCSWCICIVISYCSIKVIENIQNYISEDTGLKEMFSLQNGCAYPLGLCKMGVRAPWSLFSCSCSFLFRAKQWQSTDGDDASYLPWFASVSTHSGVLLSDWSLYTMGVHCVCVVFALLLIIVPVKSSNTDEDHLSIWYSKKKRFLYKMGLHGVHHALKRLQYYRLVSSCEISTSFPLCDFCSLQNDLWGWCFSCVWFCSLQKGFLGIQRGHFEIPRGHPRFFTKWPLGIFRCPKIWPQFWLYWFILMVFFGKRCHFTKWVLSVSSTCVPLQNGMGQLRGVEHTQLVETHFWVPPWVLYKMPLHDPKG